MNSEFTRSVPGQLRACAVPMTVAVVVSVLLAKAPVTALIIIGFALPSYGYWRGWRIRIVKPSTTEPKERTCS